MSFNLPSTIDEYYRMTIKSFPIQRVHTPKEILYCDSTSTGTRLFCATLNGNLTMYVYVIDKERAIILDCKNKYRSKSRYFGPEEDYDDGTEEEMIEYHIDQARFEFNDLNDKFWK